MENLLLTANFEDVARLVMFVFGILSLILFFKIWGMTNDVKAIREKLIHTEPPIKPADIPQTNIAVFCKSMNEKGIFKGMENGQAEIEFSDGGIAYLPLSDIEPIDEFSGKLS